MEFQNISYRVSESGEHDNLWEFDLYVDTPEHDAQLQPMPLICFVHGGAWRSEDKAGFRSLARKLVALTHFPVAVPNYRLTTQKPESQYYHLQHPAHSEDILHFLNFLLAWEGPTSSRPHSDSAGPTSVYDPQRIFLIGHSCSAHMLASIFLDSSAVTPTLTPSPQLYQAVQAIIVSEGIYDIDLLLANFPRYREWFIADTFDERESYVDFSVNKYPLRNFHTAIKWFIIHSKGDSLVDLIQSETIYNRLIQLYRASSYPVDSISRDADNLAGEHNDILHGDEYPQIIGTYILQLCVPSA